MARWTWYSPSLEAKKCSVVRGMSAGSARALTRSRRKSKSSVLGGDIAERSPADVTLPYSRPGQVRSTASKLLLRWWGSLYPPVGSDASVMEGETHTLGANKSTHLTTV